MLTSQTALDSQFVKGARVSVLARDFDARGATGKDRWSYQHFGQAWNTLRLEGVIEEVPSSSTGTFLVRFDHMGKQHRSCLNT